MGVDTQIVSDFCQKSFHLFAVPISLCIGLYLLWQYLGPISLLMLLVMMGVVPLSLFIMKRANSIQKLQMKFKDKRMEQLSEILNNIKILKLFGWEKPFIDKVSQIRAQELKNQVNANYYWCSHKLLWLWLPMLTTGLIFGVFALVSGRPLTTKTAFVSLLLIANLRNPITRVPNILNRLVRAIVSYKRILKYLSSEELQSIQQIDGSDDDSIVSLNGCSFTWSLKDEPNLIDIDLNIKKGSLIAIIGRVGSGKSSLYAALMGDMYRKKGFQQPVKGSVAYVPQTAWIQNTTLRQNIVFISDYESERYDRVVTACALKPDFDLLPARDMTEIGEKGINLSGGQKHRVSLARAVYQDSDIYLLDDPLSAVDAHVAQHLFYQVIGPTGLLSQKTRLLATHNTQFLKDVDHIIVMSAGRIIGSGSYEELSSKGLLSKQILSDSDNNSDRSEDSLQEQSTRRLSTKGSIDDKQITLKEIMEKEAERAQLIDEEHQQIGNIGYTIYLDYFRRCGIFFILISFMTTIVQNMCEVGDNYFLNIWSSQNATQIEEPSNKYRFLTIYISVIFVNALFVGLSQVIYRLGTIRAGAQLHKEMLSSIMRTPLQFFDTTPLGRIINRFNGDIYKIDFDIPLCSLDSFSSFIWFSIILGIILYGYPLMVVQLLIVIVVFVILYVCPLELIPYPLMIWLISRDFIYGLHVNYIESIR